jgi:hypothetical protein
MLQERVTDWVSQPLVKKSGRSRASFCRSQSSSGRKARSLLRKHGAIVVDDACAAALEMGVPTYRFVRRYLDRNPMPPLALRQVDPLIRELTQYRDHINRMTKEPPDEPR